MQKRREVLVRRIKKNKQTWSYSGQWHFYAVLPGLEIVSLGWRQRPPPARQLPKLPHCGSNSSWWMESRTKKYYIFICLLYLFITLFALFVSSHWSPGRSRKKESCVANHNFIYYLFFGQDTIDLDLWFSPAPRSGAHIATKSYVAPQNIYIFRRFFTF